MLYFVFIGACILLFMQFIGIIAAKTFGTRRAKDSEQKDELLSRSIAARLHYSVTIPCIVIFTIAVASILGVGGDFGGRSIIIFLGFIAGGYIILDFYAAFNSRRRDQSDL